MSADGPDDPEGEAAAPGAETATLARVAELAGVSRMTVSRVLRDRGPIAPHTRERVMAAVRRTGYVPNPLAGALASARSSLVPVIVPTLANIVFTQVLSGISDTLEPTGRQVVLGVTEYDQATEETLIATMLSWRPSGLVVTGLEHSARARALLAARSTPLVEIMDVDGEALDGNVGLSQAAAGETLARHLIAKGYRRFVLAGTRIQLDLRAGKRMAAFRRVLAEAGCPTPGEVMAQDVSGIALGGELFRRALEQRVPGRGPLAVQFTNDDLAVGAVLHALSRGIDVPGRVAIAGFNGLEIGQSLPQPLTTLRTPLRAIGEEAARLVLARGADGGSGLRRDLGFTLLPGATS